MARRRTNAQERWRRLQGVRALVEKGRPYGSCVEFLCRRYGVSIRQAKRYLADARGVSVGRRPAPKAAVCITIDQAMLLDVRRAARRNGRSVSAEVETALRSYMATSVGR